MSLLLCFLYKRDCKAKPSSRVLTKYVEDATDWALVIIVDENTAYIVKISRLTRWCQDNTVALNVNNTKELIVHFRRSSRDRAPIYINRTPAEQVSEFNFFGITITEDLKWSR